MPTTRALAVTVSAIAAAAIACSTGVAGASPFCYKTGPGYEKCFSSPRSDPFHPIYQGPELPDGAIWAPSAPDPVRVPVPVPVPVVVPAAPVPDANLGVNNSGGDDFVSLAASPSDPGAAAYGTATTQDEADRIALGLCGARNGADCRIAAQAFHACAAFALTTRGDFVAGGGPDIAAASADALSVAPGGRAVGGHCATPPGN